MFQSRVDYPLWISPILLRIKLKTQFACWDRHRTQTNAKIQNGADRN